MSRCGLNPWGRCAGGAAALLLLLLCLGPVANAASTTKGGEARVRASSEKHTAATAPASQPAAVATPPSPPAKPSLLDNESIRRRAGSTSGAATHASSTQASSPPAPQPFEFRRVVLALGAVIALIFGLKWVAKRVLVMPGSVRASRTVQVLSRSPLAPRQQVLLLQVGRRVVVVADSGGSMSTLCQIDDPDEVTSLLAQIMAERGMATPKAFGSVFGRSQNRFDSEMERGEEISTALDGVPAEDTAQAPAVDEARSEIRGLMDKVRQMSSQFRASRGEGGA